MTRWSLFLQTLSFLHHFLAYTTSWDSTSRAQSEIGDRSSGELRVVAIICNPASDAEDRLRRLFTVLLGHTAGERQTPPPAEDNLFGNEREGSDGGRSRHRRNAAFTTRQAWRMPGFDD